MIAMAAVLASAGSWGAAGNARCTVAVRQVLRVKKERRAWRWTCLGSRLGHRKMRQN